MRQNNFLSFIQTKVFTDQNAKNVSLKLYKKTQRKKEELWVTQKHVKNT